VGERDLRDEGAERALDGLVRETGRLLLRARQRLKIEHEALHGRVRLVCDQQHHRREAALLDPFVHAVYVVLDVLVQFWVSGFLDRDIVESATLEELSWVYIASKKNVMCGRLQELANDIHTTYRRGLANCCHHKERDTCVKMQLMETMYCSGTT